MITRLVFRVKGIIGYHGNAAKGVYNLLKSREIHPEIIIDVNAVEHRQGIHAHLYSVNSRVGELVWHAAGNGERYIVISGSGNQYNLAGIRVDHGKDVYIAAAFGNQLAGTAVHAADVERKYGLAAGLGTGIRLLRFCGGLGYLRFHLRDGGFFNLAADVFVACHFLKNIQISGIENHGVRFPVQQGVYQGRKGVVFHRRNGNAKFLVKLRHGIVRIFPVQAGKDAVGIPTCLLGKVVGIVCLYINTHFRNLCVYCGNAVGGLQGPVHIEKAHCVQPGE